MIDVLFPASLVTALVLAYWAVGRHAPNALLATLVVGLWTVYAGVAGAGFAGALSLPGIVVGLAVSFAVVFGVGRALASAAPPAADGAGNRSVVVAPASLLVPVGIVAVVFLPARVWEWIPFLGRALPVPSLFLNHLANASDDGAIAELNVDVFTYHIPVFVEFLQQGSFAIGANPFQSYGFGWESIFGLPLLSVRSHYGFVVGNAVAALLAVVSLFVVAEALFRRDGDGDGGAVARSSAFVRAMIPAAIGYLLLSLTLPATVGKNDVAQAALVLAALAAFMPVIRAGALQRIADGRQGRPREVSLVQRREWIASWLVSLAAMALAVAVKPSALGYLPCWVLTAAAALHGAERPRLSRHAWAGLAAAAVVTAVLGAGFLLRNLATYGALSDPEMRFAYDFTLATMLRRGEWHLLESRRDMGILVLFVLGVAACAFMALRLDGARRRVAGVVWLWTAAGSALFFVTPWSVFYDVVIQWRLGFAAMLLAMTATVGGALTVSVVERLFSGASRRGARPLILKLPPLPVRRASIVALGILPIALLLVAGAMGRHGFRGFPWSEAILGQPTEVYRWVQEQPAPLRIYSAGLVPYGLLGPELANDVFFDYRSEPLLDDASGRGRLRAIIEDFRPDLIVIAAALRDGRAELPQREWLGGLACLRERHADAMTVAFSVVADCRPNLATVARPPERPRMAMFTEEPPAASTAGPPPAGGR